jgi:hypothetical protein
MIKVVYEKSKLDGIISGLEGSPAAIRAGLEEAMFSSLLQVHSKAVPNAPYKTGTLRRSLSWAMDKGMSGGRIEGAVGSNLVYARIHELGGNAGRGGSVAIKGKRYLGRAVDSSTNDIRKRFANIRLLKKS